jgi:hypothetical protein
LAEEVFEAEPDDFAAEVFELEPEDFAAEVFEPAPEAEDLADEVFEADGFWAAVFEPALELELDDLADEVFAPEPEDLSAAFVVDFAELLADVFDAAVDDLPLEEDLVAAVFELDDLLAGAAFAGAAFLVAVDFVVVFFVGIRFSPNWVNFSKSQTVSEHSPMLLKHRVLYECYE